MFLLNATKPQTYAMNFPSQYLNIVNFHQQLFSDHPVTRVSLYTWEFDVTPTWNSLTEWPSGEDIAKQEHPTAEPAAWESITQKLLSIKKLN